MHRLAAVGIALLLLGGSCGGDGPDDERSSGDGRPTQSADADLAETSLLTADDFPGGLSPSGVRVSDETPVGRELFAEHGGRRVAAQIWTGGGDAGGITFISDIRYEFADSRGATRFFEEAQPILEGLLVTLEDPGNVKRRFTYIWATGELVGFVVVGGIREMKEENARLVAVRAEDRMEIATGVDSDEDGAIGPR